MAEYHRNVLFPINYVFTCLKCGDTVTTSLPLLHEHGWIEVSTHGNPNQWLCPACGRGFKKASAEPEKPSQKREVQPLQRRQINHLISALQLNTHRDVALLIGDIAMDLFKQLVEGEPRPASCGLLLTLSEDWS